MRNEASHWRVAQRIPMLLVPAPWAFTFGRRHTVTYARRTNLRGYRFDLYLIANA